MAQIDSIAIGEGRKSIGNITYRYVNGVTIASKKIRKNNSQTPEQVKQRSSFGITGKLAKALKPLIEIGYVKNNIGAKHANFIHENKSFMNYARTSPNITAETTPIQNLYEAVNDSTFEGSVVIANGNIHVTSVFSIEGGVNLVGTIYLTRPFIVGDYITIAICNTYKLVGSAFESIQVYSKTLTEQDIAALAINNQFVVNNTTIPGLNDSDLPPGYSDLKRVIATIIDNEKERSYSVFQSYPVTNPGGL